MKQLCLFIFFLFCGICDAQNLVPNPSFEDTVMCPDFEDQIDRAVGWSKYSIPSSTPDYYNACASPGTFGVPNGTMCHQNAHTGNAFAAVVTFARFITNYFYREHIGIQLTQPLTIGQKYFISFYTVMAEELHFSMPGNKLGIRLSTVAYNPNTPAPIDNFAHLFTDSLLSDTVNWKLISGSIIADSAYNYLIIGSFFDDANTDTIIWDSINSRNCYFAIDDICVSTDSLTCNPLVGINEVKNEDELVMFPNPFTDKINITVKRNEVVEVGLYDVTSRKIFNQSFTNSTSINTKQLAKGIYLYEVRNKSGVIKKGKIVKD